MAGGFFRTPNKNCANCTPDDGASCVMRSNSTAICAYTPKHFGWGRVPHEDRRRGVARVTTRRPTCSAVTMVPLLRHRGRARRGYPTRIAQLERTAVGFTAGIDAALFREDNNALYFFKGNQYVRFSAGPRRWTAATQAHRRQLAGLPANFPPASTPRSGASPTARSTSSRATSTCGSPRTTRRRRRRLPQLDRRQLARRPARLPGGIDAASDAQRQPQGLLLQRHGRTSGSRT